jgi:hypothetical protein
MSELKKKRMRYEVLEDVESFLLNRIKSHEEEIEWKSAARDDGEPIPEWRLEEIQDHKDKIVEIKEVIKSLAKL